MCRFICACCGFVLAQRVGEILRKICLTFGYDGTNYHGFQRQHGQSTIQETVEKALSRLTQEPIQITGSGRTDRGVHALGQVCHFTTQSRIPAEKFAPILRDQLPPDLLVTQSEAVALAFHAQKDACFKTYRYQIETAFIPSLFERRYYTHFPYIIDVDRMKAAAVDLVGTHDFTSLCSAKTTVAHHVRTIYHCHVWTQGTKVMIEVTGNGFLYNMVRIIAGTLYQIGRNKMKVDELQRIIPAKNRSLAGPTLRPEGLVLVKVGYEPWQSVR